MSKRETGEVVPIPTLPPVMLAPPVMLIGDVPERLPVISTLSLNVVVALAVAKSIVKSPLLSIEKVP